MRVSGFVPIVTGLLTPLIWGWMPGEQKQIRALDGNNLFGPSQSHGPVARRSIALPTTKIRGVNIGALFVFEPWMAWPEWQKMGCGSALSEFDCVQDLGQAKANTSFDNHWNSWITESDILLMQSYGLNTIRVPVGYWMYEDLVITKDAFPQGGLRYLRRLCGWASDAGMFIIIDMHGAPGAQLAETPSTGQYAPAAGFYDDDEYQRGIKFLSWLTNLTHTLHEFRNVGMIEVVSEPSKNLTLTSSMINKFYPEAYAAIRAVEKSLNVAQNDSVHVQFMNELWGSGNPNQNLSKTFNVAYDDHRYIKNDVSVQVDQTAYISASCKPSSDSVKGSPTIFGEWSLSVPDDISNLTGWSTANTNFYSNFFAAQTTGYERTSAGWIFWAWKTQLNDLRWSYFDAVSAGVIPKDLSTINATVCGSAGRLDTGLGGYGLWFVVGLVMTLSCV